jgi:hypothetical protein
MNSQSHLTSIPLEILLCITSNLPTRDLGSLRRTCKHVESSLFNTFSREFFTKKQFMLSEESLQALVDISNHPRLSRCLSHVIVGLDWYKTSVTGRDLGEVLLGALDFTQAAKINRYRIGFANQFTLLSSGQDREMLTQAFRNLPNLQTIGIRDFNSGGRVRDNCEWTSYGATTIFQETGIHLIGNVRQPVSDQQASFSSRVFCTILHALGQSGAKPQAFEVLLKRYRSGLHDYAFNIPKFFEPSVKPVLCNLKTLLLTLDLSDEPMLLAIDDDYSPDGECHGYLLRRFLCHCPNLTHLRLNFQNGPPPRPERFLQWLGRPVTQADSIDSFSASPLPRSPELVALSQLRRLDFGMLSVSPHTLLDVIHKFKPTLRALSFWKVTLRPDDGPQSLDRRANMWAEFFAQLSNLDYVSVGYLSQEIEFRHRTVRFKLPASQSGGFSITKEYSRHDMTHFPNNLVSDTVVLWPDDPSDSEDSMLYHISLKSSKRDTNIFFFFFFFH